MALLEVLTLPDPRLRLKAKPVEGVDDAVRQLMDDMAETMKAEGGVGLASIQVGDPRSVVVMMLGEDASSEVIKMANPRITWQSSSGQKMSEGCLSVPGTYNEVYRATDVEVTYLDYNNELRTLKCSGIAAQCVQHELDHLEGILYVDYLSPLKKKIEIKKCQKFQKQNLP